MDTLTLWVDEVETSTLTEEELGESKKVVPVAGGSCGTSGGDGGGYDPAPSQFQGYKFRC